MHKTKTAIVIQILVDRINGGIIVDECADVNVHVNNQLEALNLIEDNYTLEVSSPGLDRPLTTKKDFKRVLGIMTRFHLNEMVQNGGKDL